VAVMGVL